MERVQTAPVTPIMSFECLPDIPSSVLDDELIQISIIGANTGYLRVSIARKASGSEIFSFSDKGGESYGMGVFLQKHEFSTRALFYRRVLELQQIYRQDHTVAVVVAFEFGLEQYCLSLLPKEETCVFHCGTGQFKSARADQ